ncbi:MAG: DNA starvation/stationary phase protection protein [Blastocatellia bacterium]|nr:DNA starvation/stationary phase protection protein [Blastocatellia bacterium]
MSQVKVAQETEVVQSLQTQLANAFLLYFNYKRYHWQSYGPHFRDLHHLFDEQGGEVLATIDELGERVRILHSTPIASPAEFTERATVIVSTGQTMKDMIEEAAQNHSTVIKELRESVEIANRANDPGTADLFTRIVQIHEKHEWFLRELLEKNDGLSS